MGPIAKRIASAAAAAVLSSIVVGLCVADSALATGSVAVARARAAEGDWSAEFEAVCSRTQDAMALPTEELRALVTRCDELKPRISALDESRRKVYAKRLQLCRDLYEFVLESREKG